MILNTKSGGIQAKILQRQANLQATHKPGPPPEQDIPLNIPKKTKLFIDLATRERENAARKFKQICYLNSDAYAIPERPYQNEVKGCKRVCENVIRWACTNVLYTGGSNQTQCLGKIFCFQIL